MDSKLCHDGCIYETWPGKTAIDSESSFQSGIFLYILVKSHQVLSLKSPCFIQSQRSAQAKDCRLMEPALKRMTRTDHLEPQ